MKKIIKYTSIALTSAAIVALPIFSASAETSNTTITANIGSTLSIQSTPTVSFNVNPTASTAKASSGLATVTVSTNNATGFNLKLAMNGTDQTLQNGAAATIAAHSGSFAAPATLANNSWGYRVENVGTFGAGNMSAQTDQNDLAGTFAAVPSNLTGGDTIKNVSAAAQSNQTQVLFGVKADSTKPSGAYSGTVVFTATAN